MQLVRQLLGDPVLVYHLFAAFDMAGERKLDAVQASAAAPALLLPLRSAALRPPLACLLQPRAAPGRAWGGAGLVQALCRAAGEVVDATLKATNKDPEDDPPLDVVAGLYCDRTAGDHSARSAVRSRQGRRGASRLRLTRPLAG
jgi:hypothetical protein